MTSALWMVHILLALAFALSGFEKVSQPVEKVRERRNWAKHVAPAVIRLIGSLEIFGALGLIVPKATGYQPWLTPVAAVGLVLRMMGAILTHVRLQEAKAVGVPVVLLPLSLFITVGYFVFVPGVNSTIRCRTSSPARCRTWSISKQNYSKIRHGAVSKIRHQMVEFTQ